MIVVLQLTLLLGMSADSTRVTSDRRKCRVASLTCIMLSNFNSIYRYTFVKFLIVNILCGIYLQSTAKDTGVYAGQCCRSDN
jgi:hypothetical protein